MWGPTQNLGPTEFSRLDVLDTNVQTSRVYIQINTYRPRVTHKVWDMMTTVWNLDCLFPLFPATGNFFFSLLNHLANKRIYIQGRRLNLTLGSSCFKSFRSSLQYQFLRITFFNILLIFLYTIKYFGSQ